MPVTSADHHSLLEKARQEAESLIRDARSKAREIIVEAKDESLEIRTKIEKESRRMEQEMAKEQRDLQSKLDKLDFRFEQIDQKEERIDQLKKELEMQRIDLEKTKAKTLEKLEEISGYSKEQAKEILFEGLEKKLSHDLAKMVAEKEEEAKLEADEKAQEILIDAMRHGATDYVAEYTVSVVNIPSEEIKGKIIGKSGRNIHSFERRTGVEIDLDSSPTEIKLSSFDPVRREIARVSMERLIKDGRIQPARIEEIVDKVEQEIERITFDAGKQLMHEVGVYNIPNGLVLMLGRFKYRFSYGQNMIKHTIEETKIGTNIAHELGLDVNVVKLGCLLHDIGKVSGNQDENHVQAGIRIAKQFNMPKEVIACIAEHHEDEPFSSPESMAVYIADAISGARPGARYENHEDYIKRLSSLEAIAMSYEEVKQAYAIQAGRELRVLLIPEKSKDDDVTILANKIRDRVQKEVIVPGNVTVTVIREFREQAITK
ncbi:MAG TPA: ribonuclease Y [Candidatus Woesebacteria bacterium]|nr:ribonuclease Y [Candidatus Woesebacteria bacterium]